MKANLFTTLFLFLVVPALAQHPLVGTWEMVSVKGLDAAGESFSVDSTIITETKIITPTHYILISMDKEGDGLIFNRCYAGTARIDGQRYIEEPLLSSLPIFDNVETNFTWAVDKDRFTQAGYFIRPDGGKITLQGLVFERNKRKPLKHKFAGVWSDTLQANGTPILLIVTPTHWMYVAYKEGKFDHAQGGPLEMQKNQIVGKVTLSSLSNVNSRNVNFKYQNNTLQLLVDVPLPNGQFERRIYRFPSRK